MNRARRAASIALLLGMLPATTVGQAEANAPRTQLRFVDRKPAKALPGTPPRWTASLASARAVAARENRSILLYFTAVW